MYSVAGQECRFANGRRSGLVCIARCIYKETGRYLQKGLIRVGM